ncbi:growth-regulating factor 1-like [Pistacia vera]|uniref:growth-regulating factor 1-like n=2 Tax=Pistacia vera TaxID=55513 RepID=UPI001263C545|nr:growth-regulating factor 1-like [Pistacia vera]
MDFGILGLDGLVVGPENGAPSSVSVSVPPESVTKFVVGSRFSKQERSGSGEDDRGTLKIPKTGDFSLASKAMSLQQGIPLLRSNPIFSASADTSRQPGQMLSFCSNKPEIALFNRSTNSFLERSPQPTVLPYYHRTPPAYPRPAGYGSGSLNVGMHGDFHGVKGPFTPSQWIELEHQAWIYKYISANVPVPPNLLIPIRKSVQPLGMPYSSTGSFSPSSYGWGSFHLGYATSTDPEPGRCRRTDGKKWRCSRDAVADQKYCERHINRGRHRSRKPVEGQTGHAASGTTNLKVVPMTSSVSTSVITSDGASNSLAITQHQFKNLQPGAAKPSVDALVSRVQGSKSGSMMSSTTNLKSNESTFPVPKQDIPFEESSQSVFGFLCSDSLLNPSQRSSYSNSKNYSGSFLDFNDHETQDQNPLRKFMDDWPKDESNRSILTWPEELKSDWTQLSMSIPIAPEFSSSSSPNREKLTLSPLRLSREFDSSQVGLGLSNDLSEPTQKLTNWIPKSWGTSMGGPLGEALTNTTNNVGTCKSSSLNLGTEGWDSSQQLGTSPTGVLQKSTFCSLSNSSSGSSSMADNKKTHDGVSIGDGSTLLSSSIPSL